ncbi:hypothetical protein GOODEAATRI_012980 [Goodea atripinnis]|uniref:Uncharacterized protein n=1 Tax=Goodea atripinnis TaxID=208336 RepID=A0ABV0N184_9TELE
MNNQCYPAFELALLTSPFKSISAMLLGNNKKGKEAHSALAIQNSTDLQKAHPTAASAPTKKINPCLIIRDLLYEARVQQNIKGSCLMLWQSMIKLILIIDWISRFVLSQNQKKISSPKVVLQNK